MMTRQFRALLAIALLATLAGCVSGPGPTAPPVTEQRETATPVSLPASETPEPDMPTAVPATVTALPASPTAPPPTATTPPATPTVEISDEQAALPATPTRVIVPTLVATSPLPTPTRVLLPTRADLGIVPTPVPTATNTPPPTPTPLPTPTPVPLIITRFLAETTSVEALALANRSAEVMLAWTVQNRVPGVSLAIEQVFPDGRVLNVERPRHFSEIPSDGSGSVAPYLPGGDAREIVLRLRAYQTATRQTLARADLRIPVNRLPDSGYVTASGEACFQQPYLPNSGLSVGARAVVSQDVLAGLPLTAISGVGGQVTGSLGRGETVTILGGPFCYRPPGSTTNYRQWQVRSDLSGQQGWALEYSGTFTSYRYTLFPFRNVVIYDPAQCYGAPFLPDRGIRVGQGAQLAQGPGYSLSIYDRTAESGQALYVGDLPAGEVFTVIGGPHCYRMEPMPQTALGLRQWQVRSEVSGLTGWVFEYSNERAQYVIPAGEATPVPGFQVRSFDVQPRSVSAGQPLTITWDVTGVNGVDVLMWHAALPNGYVSLSTTGVLLPLTGSLTVNAPEDVTAARFTVFGADTGGDGGITVGIGCRIPWFRADAPQRFCPNAPAQSFQAAYQPFERGYMLWFNNQIWAVWGGSGAVYPDMWGGGDVVYGEAPPEGRLQPVRGFGTLWVSDANVRSMLGWATAPEQGYTLQYQATGQIHRPGMRGGYVAADVTISLPDGSLLQVTRSGDSFSPRQP